MGTGDRTHGPQAYFAPSSGHTIFVHDRCPCHPRDEVTNRDEAHSQQIHQSVLESVLCKGEARHHTQWQSPCWQASGQPVVEELCFRQGKESLGEIQPPGPPKGACHPGCRAGSSCSLSPWFSGSAGPARVGGGGQTDSGPPLEFIILTSSITPFQPVGKTPSCLTHPHGSNQSAKASG